MARCMLEHRRHGDLPVPVGNSDRTLKQIDPGREEGGACALPGPSGCGKTTLFGIVPGLIRPTRGRVPFDTVDVAGLDPVDRHVVSVVYGLAVFRWV